MKWAVLMTCMCMTTLASAEEKHVLSADEKLIVAALERLPEYLKVKFDIPFPNADIDAWRKQPIALMSAEGGKVAVTQPKMQPYDGAGSIEWMMAPPDPRALPAKGVECTLHLDESGDFLQIGILCPDDPWSTEDGVKHQIFRRDDETGNAFFERAMRTYRLRAKKAKDPALAARIVTITEKISTTIVQLRKEEVRLPAK